MKKILRKVFNKLGYDIIKINVHSTDKINKVSKVKVGNYEILMPGNNPQISLYKYIPDSNEQLARLAKLIIAKYKDASMVDIGANVGDTIAVVRSQTDIPIIAVEGDDFSFSFLQKNAVQFQDLHLLKQYLGEEKKELSVTLDKAGWNNTIIPDEKSTSKISVKTLDETLNDQNLQDKSIKLLKIDTEGFDTIILRGCNKTIAKNKPVLYFEYNGENMNAIGEDGLSTIFSLKDHGYNKIHFFDCINNLILETTLQDENSLKQLNDYVARPKTMISYFDICIFHQNDEDLSDQFYRSENNATKSIN